MPVVGRNNCATLDDILKSVSQLELFKFHTGGIEPGVASISPLRKETTPSFVYNLYENGIVFFKDFGTGKSGTIINFLQEKYNINYLKALNLVLKEKPAQIVNKKFSKKRTLIQIKASNWNSFNIKYWYDYGISKNTLNFYNVVPIDYYWINGKRIKTKSSYAYIFKNGFYKILNLNNSFKWISNTGDNIVQGYSQMDKNLDTLFITSSLKDIMVLYECGFTAIALNSETSKLKESLMKILKTKYKHIIIFYDNDEKGKKTASAMQSFFDIPFIVVPKYKDPSDYSFYNGIEQTKETINKLIFPYVRKKQKR